MKAAIRAISFASVLMSAAAVQAAGVKTTCARGADARIIEVIAPGEVGQTCDVRYTRDNGANISVPYHANSSETFCVEKSQELTQRLASAGFVCTAARPALRAEAPQNAADYVVEAQRPAPVEPRPAETPAENLNDTTPDVLEEPAPSLEMASSEVEDIPDEIAQQQIVEPMLASSEALGEALSAAPAEEAETLEDEMSKILAQPVLAPASREPAQLIARQTQVADARPQPSSIGRLVGAAPETPPAAKPATPVTQASQTVSPEPVEESAAQPAAQTEAPLQQPKKPAANVKLRTPKDVIRATLMAQAAAWNEGDLDGFMDAYWKSDRLKFVSGVSMTKGWDATLKRYRDRYSGGAGLGRLGFERLDVELVTDDVAVVTGRFNLERQGEASSGMFSLVMRRDNGAWRVVHDHTNADPEGGD